MDELQIDSKEAAKHTALVSELFGNAERARRPTEDLLPFRIRAVRTHEDLQKVLRLRAKCYSRRFSHSTIDLEEPEPEDFEIGTTLLLAESKNSGEAVGCLRFMSNRFTDLNIQKHIELPERFRNRHLADIRRLSVASGSPGRFVKLALFKAVYLYAVGLQVKFLMIGAREPLIRDYLSFYFQDIDPEGLEVLLLGKPHRILFLDVNRMALNWESNKIRWFKTFFSDFHPDIALFEPLQPAWIGSRASDNPVNGRRFGFANSTLAVNPRTQG